ncbi:MAG: hypothetical protein Q9163_002258 [Psora crenata]
MSSQPHLQILNYVQATHNEESEFPLFTILPKELRSKIWRYTLQRQRMIHLRLNNRRGQTAIQAGENPESTRNGERYFTVVYGSQLLSKLLLVNRESREEALSFYRVHLPCRFAEGARVHGTVYLNPEWDFLHISAEWPAKNTLVDFLYHLKTSHDPRHIGLLNLAVDGNGLSANGLNRLQSSDLDFEARSAFVETLAQLREVSFISTPRVGRQILGGWSGLGTWETIFNRSFPILPTTPTFELLQRDPRPIAQDLKKVIGLADLRGVLQLWLQLLRKWRISPSGIEHRFFLAFDPTIAGDRISDRTSAKIWLQKEDDQWNGRAPDDCFLQNKKVEWPIGAQHEKYKNEDLEKAVRPAFGFWLFPVEALGLINEEGLLEEKGSRPTHGPFLNMTDHWPQLALSSLP